MDINRCFKCGRRLDTVRYNEVGLGGPKLSKARACKECYGSNIPIRSKEAFLKERIAITKAIIKNNRR